MRLSHLAPVACSSCFNQQPRKRHVDFEAAWDGPGNLAEEGAIRQPIDDLILCEDCIREAGRLVGMVKKSGDDPAGKIAELEQQVAAERAGRIDLMRRLQQIKGAVEFDLVDVSTPKPPPVRNKQKVAA